MEFSFTVGLWQGTWYMTKKLRPVPVIFRQGIFFKDSDIIAEIRTGRKHNLADTGKSRPREDRASAGRWLHPPCMPSPLLVPS
jgi:hypothetical protein